MVQVMYLEKCNKLNVKGRVWGILVDTFKNAIDVCECIIVPSTSFNINKKKRRSSSLSGYMQLSKKRSLKVMTTCVQSLVTARSSTVTWSENFRYALLTLNMYIYIYIYIYIRSSCFCEIWALCVSWITYDHLYMCIHIWYYRLWRSCVKNEHLSLSFILFVYTYN